MTANYINSDEINSVPFPGAESGASLVQLVGEIQASGALSSVTLRLLATAAIACTATTSIPAAKARFGVTPTTECVAATTATAQSKVRLSPVVQPAIADSFASAICKRAVGGSATAAAVQTAPVSKVMVSLGASAAPAAETTAFAFRKWPVYPNAVFALASTYAQVLSKVLLGASTQGQPVSSVAPIERHQISAIQSASVASTVNAVAHQSVSGNAVAAAVAPAFTSRAYLRTPVTISAVANGLVNAIDLVPRSASVAASAITPNINAALVMHFAAATVATVSSAIAAADYSATMPAPLERRMALSPILRRMEVTE